MAELGPLLRKDAWRGARAAVYAGALLALFELVVTLVVAQGPIRFPTVLRFVALDVTLVCVFCLLLAPLCAALFAAVRLMLLGAGPGRARAFAGVGGGPGGESPATSWFWALLLAGAGYAAASIVLTLFFTEKFKERFLVAVSLAVLQLLLIALFLPLALLLAAGVRRLGARLRPLGAWNPLLRWLPALGLLLLLLAGPLFLLLKKMPQLRDVMPWRLLFAALVLVLGVVRGARHLAVRGTLLPTRALRLGLTGLLVIVVPLTLVFWGGNLETKYLAVSASPTLSKLVELVRVANDFDRDGYGSLLGENDCAPFNPRIHPNAPEIPDNGIDENCNGRDFSLKNARTAPKGARMPIPAEFKRDWNFLFVTVDAVRYDHTGMGGYRQKSGRDTTPNLDLLAKKSVVFDFANAPSAGTMASVPALQTSKFFHSGIAVGPERRPMPPKILPENLMLAEVMKRRGYHTGAILTHEYFNDWGMEQGFDSYDNSLGKKPDPNSITSQDVTSKAEAWIAQQGDEKWFLWAHYLDPHGRYVAHPGELQFSGGDSEEDLYDGEIAYTDKYLGKLLDFLSRSPIGSRTVVVVTADHGDGFMEHGQRNHGMSVYRELLHVPLLIYVPENEARRIPSVVSGLDVFPTLADLAGIDISDDAIEGESLVPQVFYGKDDPERIIFAETNWPEPLRTAITSKAKLIYNLKTNVYQLFDLTKDPWEKRSVWGQWAEGDKLKSALDDWLDRVFYSRDPLSQAQRVRAEQYLLPARPTPGVMVDGSAGGAIHLLGYDAKAPAPAGKTLEVTVYFEGMEGTPQNLRATLEMVALGDPVAPPMVTYQRYPAGDGMFPSSKWHPGDWVKETYPLRIPLTWTGRKARLQLRFLDEKRQPVAVTGARTADAGKVLVLGEIEVGAATP